MDDDVDTDCVAAIAHTWWFLDDECSAGLHRTLTRHLSACPECWAHYLSEARMKLVVATKAAGERAPDRLRRFWSPPPEMT